jgi:hypothetical protein
MAGEGLSRTITTTSSGDTGPTITGSVTLAGNEGVPFSQTVPASSTDTPYLWAFAYATLKSIDISAATGTGADTVIKFYNASSLLQTFTLADGMSRHWDIDEFNANNTTSPAWFASNVTSVKITTTDESVVNGNAVLIV